MFKHRCQDCRLQTSSHALGSDAKQSSSQGAGLILPRELAVLREDSDRQWQGLFEKIQTKLPEERRIHKDMQAPERSMCLECANTTVLNYSNALQSLAVFQIKCCIWYTEIYWPIFFLSFKNPHSDILHSIWDQPL